MIEKNLIRCLSYSMIEPNSRYFEELRTHIINKYGYDYYRYLFERCCIYIQEHEAEQMKQDYYNLIWEIEF